jgi:hypothetical protein
MHYIHVPEVIYVRPPPQLAPNAEPEPLPFYKFALTVWLNDPRAIEGGFAKQVRWAKVLEKFAEALPGGHIALEDEDYNTLRPIVERPGGTLQPTIAVQLLPYSQAVLDATTEPPAHLASPATPDGKPTAEKRAKRAEP